MQESEIRAALGNIPLSGLRFFESIGSTNDEAAAWVSRGAADFSLVIADEQTAGRGRSGAKWFTPAGSALAFSLILRPPDEKSTDVSRVAGLGALGVADACARQGLQPEIKWPNDILLGGRKVAGILVESVWNGNQLEGSVLGVGVNVLAAAVPPPEAVAYPATSLETEVGRPIDRLGLLGEILSAIRRWRELIHQDVFIQAWEDRLAFRGREVILREGGGAALTGTLLGLDPDGSARLRANHKIVTVQVGQISLRPADDRMA